MPGPTRRLRAALPRLPGTDQPLSQRTGRIVLAAAVVAAVAAAGFGAGSRSAPAFLGDGGAWLQKDHGLVHVNLDNQDADARAAKELADGNQTLEIVQTASATVWVLNNETGTISKLDTATTATQTAVHLPESRKDLAIVPGGGQVYLVDSAQGTLTRMESPGSERVEVPTPEKIDQAVVDPTGRVWAYSRRSGELFDIVAGKPAGRHAVANPGEAARLTLVGDAPVIYRPDSGQADRYGPDGLVLRLDLSAHQGLLSMAVAERAGGGGSTMVVVVPRGGEVVVADFDTRDVRRTVLDRRAGHQFGQPIVHKGRVYVADFTTRHVIVLDLPRLGTVAAVPVPGTSHRFTMTLRDGQVWAHDPYDKAVVAFDGSGRVREFDVDPTDGIDAPVPAPSAPPTTSPTPTPAVPSAELVTVPDVRGMDIDEACARINERLRCRRVAVPTGRGETGRVLSQRPPAGSKLEAKRSVTLSYRGPATVPDLGGMSGDEACAALQTASLRCVRLVTGPAPTATELGRVHAQQPTPNAGISTGAEVTISVYDATLIRVPDVPRGTPIGAACAPVRAVGLPCTVRDIGPGEPTGVVVRQSPAANTGLATSGAVSLDHHGSSDRVAVPSVVGLAPAAACARLAAAQLGCVHVAASSLRFNVVVAQDPPAGAVAGHSTAVGIHYVNGGTPAALLRYKAPARRANYLGLGAGPAGWSTQSSPGRVYPASMAGQLPGGLTAVYNEYCCNGRQDTYYLSMSPVVQNRYVREPVPAFACFTQQVEGTVALLALFRHSDGVWVWVRQGSWEEQVYRRDGWGSQFDHTTCYIWPP